MIHTKSQATRFQTEFTNGNQFSMADTTADKGGGNSGFRPHDLLEAALASCMNMSLRMYAEKHSFPLTSVSVSVSLNRANLNEPSFEYSVDFQGSLSEAQKSQLFTALENCPVRNTLSKPLQFRLCER